MYRIPLIGLLVLSSLFLQAQDDLDRFFEDGGASDQVYNAFRYDLGGLFGANLIFSYERMITETLSIQASAGPTVGLTRFDNSVLDPNFNHLDSQPLGGYVISIQPKIYYVYEVFEGGYYGLMLRHRQYDMIHEEDRETDICLMYGLSAPIAHRINMDFAVGIGYKSIKTTHKDTRTETSETKMALPLRAQIGYLF